MTPNASTKSYLLRPLLTATPQAVTLAPEGLQGLAEGMIPWQGILKVNLSYGMASEYNEAYYLCRLTTTAGKFQVLAAVEAPDEQATYRAFLLALHAALLGAPHRPHFTMGMTSEVGYRLLWAIGLVAGALLAALIVYAMATKGKVLIGMALLLVVVACTGLFLRLCRRTLRPRSYEPAAIPPMVLPSGAGHSAE